MATIIRKMSTISRCINIYRSEKSPEDLPGIYHGYVFAIYNNPGMPQEWLAKHMFFNKSTVARHLAQLEKAGYIERCISPKDKRELLVYPTEKMNNIYLRIKKITQSWNEIISEEISPEELEAFNNTLDKILKKSIEISEKTEVDNK